MVSVAGSGCPWIKGFEVLAGDRRIAAPGDPIRLAADGDLLGEPTQWVRYTDDLAGGHNDFTSHLVMSSLQYRF